MGNINNIQEGFGCYDISKNDYLDLRTKSWAFHQGYLYQTQLQQVGDEMLNVVTYEINVEDREFKTYFQKLQMMGKYLTKGNIQLPLLCIAENNQDCTFKCEQTSQVKFFYEHFDIHLSEELKARQNYKQKFSQTEIWYIFYNILNALRQFEPFCQPSGNLTTKEVLMNSRGQVKIQSSLTSPFEPSRSSIFTNYFAPEQLEIMRKAFNNEGDISRAIYKQFNINPNLCQVFSLAILLIVLTTKCHHILLYSPPFMVNEQSIKSSIEKMSSLGYSKLLTNLVKVMIAPYRNRPFPHQIYETFKQFQYEIQSLKPFNMSMKSSGVHSIF